jgi:gamma-glutamyltranspeptidase/glutathione hydrolase
LGCDIAKGIVEGQKFNRPQAPNGKGGSMTYADLENYQAIVRAPVVGTYRGYVIKSVAPPSSGGLTILQMLKMLERFPLGDASQGFGFGSLKTANVMADAMRLAFADRGIWMGDSDFVPVPAKGLLNPTYVGQRSALIVPGARINPNPAPGDPRPFETAGLSTGTRLAVADPVTGPGETTTHYSVVDKWGQHGDVHQHHRVLARHRCFRGLQGRKRLIPQFRLPAQQRAHGLQHHAFGEPVHRQPRLQRRAAQQAPAQQHVADDDLHAGR